MLFEWWRPGSGRARHLAWQPPVSIARRPRQGAAESRPCVAAHCAGLDSLRRACRARAVPVLGAVPGPGVTAGRARAWGAGRPAKALRRHSSRKEGKRRAGGGEGTRSVHGATVQRGGGRGPLRRGEWARHGGRHPCFRWARVAAGASSACALRRATSGSVPTPCRFAPLGATWLFLVE